jgi:LPS sulfotransferase NodH
MPRSLSRWVISVVLLSVLALLAGLAVLERGDRAARWWEAPASGPRSPELTLRDEDDGSVAVPSQAGPRGGQPTWTNAEQPGSVSSAAAASGAGNRPPTRATVVDEASAVPPVVRLARTSADAEDEDVDKDEDDGRFMIITGGRTGSTLLVSLLDSHPEIACAYEVFHPLTAYVLPPLPNNGTYATNWTAQQTQLEAFYRGEVKRVRLTAPARPGMGGAIGESVDEHTPDDDADSAAAAGAGPGAPRKLRGLKHMYHFVHHDLRGRLVDWLATTRPRVTVVHLWRRHRVEQFLSMRRGMSSNRWHVRVNRTDMALPTATPMNVTWADFAVFARYQEDQIGFYRRALADHPRVRYMEVTYEDLHAAALRPRMMRTLLAFLGVRNVDAPLTSDLVKVNVARPCAARIVDWQSFRRELAVEYPVWLRMCEDVPDA